MNRWEISRGGMVGSGEWAVGSGKLGVRSFSSQSDEVCYRRGGGGGRRGKRGAILKDGFLEKGYTGVDHSKLLSYRRGDL